MVAPDWIDRSASLCCVICIYLFVRLSVRGGLFYFLHGSYETEEIHVAGRDDSAEMV